MTAQTAPEKTDQLSTEPMRLIYVESSTIKEYEPMNNADTN